MSKIAIWAYRAKEMTKKKNVVEKELEEVRNSMEGLALTIRSDMELEEPVLTSDEVNEIEKETDDFVEKEKELEEVLKDLNSKIQELETNINEANDKKEQEDETEVSEEEERSENKKTKVVRENGEMSKATRGFFKGLERANVEQLIERKDVKDFVERTRDLIKQDRAVSGAELAIPDVFLGIMRDNMHNYSKLIKHINLRPVRGTARQIVSGGIPEAVWTEMCANLNELEINFNQVSVDGYKVGGYIAVCNSTLQDSDIGLANEIMTNISQAIGFALDKAILYGKGDKMPVGIATRLAEAVKPAYWGVNEPDWVDLSTSNIKTLDGTGLELFKAVFGAVSNAKSNFSTGTKFFAMNETTYLKLQMEGLSINLNGAMVSAVNGTMPFVGGAVELLDFIPDGDIIGGYGSNYLLAEREGATLESSRHAQFIAQNTVFLGSARYDGRPVLGNSFVVMNVNNVAPTTTMTFAADSANV